MRTIKFRGKGKDSGRWHYGDLRRNDDKIYIEDNGRIYAVMPETVGQFAGLLDKNGNEIYEGDILHAIGGNDDTTGKHFYRPVSFVEGCFCLNVTEYNNVSIPLRNHIISHSLNWDIAGNIYDNPELLKGGGK